VMTVIGKKDGKITAYIKGAPDVLMRNASKVLINGEVKSIAATRERILKQNEDFAEHALRVLGVAYKELEPNYDINEVEKEFTYIGLVGIIDPPRDEVKDAILTAREAGIRTIMITGDHKNTALAIGKQIGLANSQEAITGVELESMSDDELMERYLDETEISADDIKRVIRKGTITLQFFPVLFGASFKNKGVHPLLDAVTDYLPSPMDIPSVEGHHPRTLERETRKASDEEAFSALVFKIMNDPYAGTLSFFRVYSGKTKVGASVYNATKEEEERVKQRLRDLGYID